MVTLGADLRLSTFFGLRVYGLLPTCLQSIKCSLDRGIVANILLRILVLLGFGRGWQLDLVSLLKQLLLAELGHLA